MVRLPAVIPPPSWALLSQFAFEIYSVNATLDYTLLLGGHDPGKIGNLSEYPGNRRQEGNPVEPYCFIFRHHEDGIKKVIHWLTQTGYFPQCGKVITAPDKQGHPSSYLEISVMQD
jgi:hypothetical protein